MHRAINVLLLIVTFGSAFANYAIKYDTRRLEQLEQSLVRERNGEEAEIAMLTATYANLARPDRIEPMARQIGMAPVGPRQYLRLEASGPAPVTP